LHDFICIKFLFSSEYMYLFPKVTLLPFDHLDGDLQASSVGSAWAGRLPPPGQADRPPWLAGWLPLPLSGHVTQNAQVHI
jgi:hypothetical protein